MTRPDIMRLLMLASITAGIVFILVSSVESIARPGFDLRRHAISMLSLGERGWLMIATFIVSGALTLLCAIVSGMSNVIAPGIAFFIAAFWPGRASARSSHA